MATRFWVGGGATTNWNATGSTNWATSSGGANDASVPTTGDDVILDANSGSGTSTVNATFSLNSFDADGFTGTKAGTGVITVTGNDAGAPGGVAFRFGAGMTRTWSGLLSLAATSGTASIQPNGKGVGNGLTIDGVGGTFELLGPIFSTDVNVGLTLTNGIWNGNGHNCSFRGYSSFNSNVRNFNPGSGAVLTCISGDGSLWNFSATNLTTALTGVTIRFAHSGSGSGLRTFNGANQDYSNAVVEFINAARSARPITITGNNTFGEFTATNVANMVISGTNTFTEQPTFGGAANAPMVLQGSAGGGTITTEAALTFDWMIFQGLTKAGGGSIAGTNSFDGGSVTEITITPPAPAVHAYVIGG